MPANYDFTIAELKNRINAEPKNHELHLELGLVYYAAKKPEEALASFDRAIELSPADSAAHNNRGIVLSALKRYPEAIEAFNKAVEINPAYASAYNNMGVALINTGKLDDAVGAYNKAVELEPEFTHALRNLCKGLEEQKKLPEAIEVYRKLEAVTWCELWKQHGLDPEAVLDGMIKDCRTALETTPDDAAHMVFLGRALYHKNQAAQAVPLFQKVLEIDKDNADAHYLLALALIAAKSTNA